MLPPFFGDGKSPENQEFPFWFGGIHFSLSEENQRLNHCVVFISESLTGRFMLMLWCHTLTKLINKPRYHEYEPQHTQYVKYVTYYEYVAYCSTTLFYGIEIRQWPSTTLFSNTHFGMNLQGLLR